MGLSKTDNFNCELNKISAYSKISLPLYIEVTDTNVTPALSKLHLCFNSLLSSVQSYKIEGVNLVVATPEQVLANPRFINISKEDSIKIRTRISIGLIVEADLSSLNGFWNKTKALGDIIDKLDNFCDVITKEKNHSAYLDRSRISENLTNTKQDT